MNQSVYQQVHYISMVAHLMICLVTLGAVIIGWKRHRQAGYLMLVAWSFAYLMSMLGSLLWIPWVQRLLPSGGGGIDPTMVMIVGNVLSGLAASVLLCVGIALLVFSAPRPR